MKQGTYKKMIALCMATVLTISTAAVGKPAIKSAQAAGPADIGEVYDGIDLSNGTWAGSSRQSSYYFGQNEGKPNLWRLLETSDSNGYKTGLLLSESSIGTDYFRCASNWEYATIRTYLNGAFLEGLPQQIKESLLNDTKDAVFLLSKDKAEELSSADRAGIGAWWLKTANNNNAWDVQYVDNDGTFKSSNAESKKGIRPALTLDKSKVSGFSFAGEGTEEEPYTIDPAGGTSGEQIIKDDYIQFSLRLDGADSDVQWKVIGESNNDITILAHSSIETQSFNNDSSSWVNSDIRRYLDLETGNENSLSVTAQEKSRMKISEADGAEGTQEFLYLLSKEEAENTNYFADDSDRSIGSTWWLRTARSGNLYSVYYVGKNGSTTGSDNAVSVSKHGIRPAFKLDLESIIFASEIRRNVNVDKTPWLTPADDNYSAASKSSAQNMKLTFLNENLNLAEFAYDATSLAGDGSTSITANGGETLILSGKGSASGAGMTINYKIVKSNKTKRDIVGYGIGTPDVTGNNDSININTIDMDGEVLAAGEYTVYVWLQKNNDTTSHEGSKPSYVTLTIENTGVTNTIQVNDGVDFDDLLNLGNGNNGIYFGTYQHVAKLKSQSYGEVRTRDSERKPILWNIRGKQAANYEDSSNPDQIALLSEYILDSKQYNKNRAEGSAQWETSPIRTWLNGEFFTDNFKSFEQEAVTETKNLRTTDVKGENVSYTDDQLYLLNEDPNNKSELDNVLSLNEKKSTLKNGAGVPGINWWTRSLGTASYGEGVDVVQYNGNTKIKWVTDYHGIRPAFKLDPESIIFASEVVKDAKAEEPWYTPEDNYYKEAEASGKNSKLTLLNRKLSLSTLTHGTNSIANNGSSEILVRPGKRITLRGRGNIAEDDMSIRYKIVKSNGSKREIVGYGIGAAEEVTNNEMCDITIPAMDFSGNGLDDGTYTVHVWLQRSNAINSDEGSMPKQFTMLVQTEDINVIGSANDGVDFDDLLDTKKGRFVYYGTYDHAYRVTTGETTTVDKEDFDKPVLWRVQGKQTADPNGTKEHISLFSKYVLDYKRYNDSSESMDPSQRWETSGIRTWLNFDFINENFKEDSEQAAMEETKDLKTTNDQSEFLQSTDDKMYLLTYDTKNENNFETFHSLEESDKTATLRNENSATWWLRSPSSDSENQAIYVESDGSANNNDQVHEYRGIRPGFKLDSESIIFASEIKNGVNTMETPWYTLASLDKCQVATESSAKNYKLTVVNEKLELKLSKEGADFQSDTASELVAKPGGEIKLTGEGYYDGEAVDIGCMIYYKIVKNNKSSKREIVSYGIGQTRGLGEITIPVKDFDGKALVDGEYTVYAWLQRNDDLNSNEGSQPLYFTLMVMEESNMNVGVDEYMNLTGEGNRWIYFGQYEHVLEASEAANSYTVNKREEKATPMKWLMLGKSPVVYEDQDDVIFDGNALEQKYVLVAQYCLDTMAFGVVDGNNGDMWETSIPRTWLNGGFREDNFEEAEKKEMVQSKNMRTDSSGDYANDGRTTDWFYLMNDTGASTWSLANVLNDNQYSYFYNGDSNIAIEPANGTSTKDKIINVGASWKFDDTCNWWLRTDAYNKSGSTRLTRWQMFVDRNGALQWDAGSNTLSTYKEKSKAIRPVFNLNPDNIVFASEVLDDVTGKSWTTQSYANDKGDWVYEEENISGKAFKLTVLGTESANENGDIGLELVDLKSNGEAFNKTVVKTGDSFEITGIPYQYKDDNLEDYSINYKIVETDESDASNHTIIAAGMGQANLVDGDNTITITAKDFEGKTLNGGYYTVYVWLQKNNDTNSNEASVPQPFLLKVDTTAPSVIEITPKDGDIGVAKDGSINLTFNTPIGGVGTVVLKNEETSEQIELDTAVLASDDGKTYTVSYSGLDSSTKYTIIIAGFKNKLGITMMKDTSNSFTTIYEAGVSKDTMELLRKGNNEASDSFTIYLGDATSATIQSADTEYVTVSSESIAISGGGAQEITVTGKKSTSSVAENAVVITVRIYGAGAPVVKSIAVTVKQEYEITTQYVRGNELIGAGETRTIGDAAMDHELFILTEEDKTELIENIGLIPSAYALKTEDDIKNLSDEEVIADLEDSWNQWDDTKTIKMSDYLDNITIYIKCLTTQVDIEIPVEMEFKANYDEDINKKGKISSDGYVMTNNSDLPVKVYLKQLSSSDQMDGIVLVENIINGSSSDRMQLALKGTSTTSSGFNQTIDNIVPDDEAMGQKLLGTLEGVNTNDPNNKTGSFTIGGQYEGRFPIMIPKRPRVIFEFHFAIDDTN